MGVYLSEPITDKHIKEGESKDYTYCVAEMQGKNEVTQGGASRWRTPPSTRLIWEMGTRFSQCSMGMVVRLA